MKRVNNSLKTFWELLKITTKAWYSRDPWNNSIIISYYTIFSLPGLLVIIVNVVGYFLSKEDIIAQITFQVEDLMGPDTASDIESIISRASQHRSTLVSSVIGVSTLLFGATGVFNELQVMLNKIWQVKPRIKTSHVILILIRNRLFSFGLILAVGFLLLVSLVLSAALSVFGTWITTHLSGTFTFLLWWLDTGMSIGIITFLFASLFKFLPDVPVRWKDVWGGAFLTAILFVVAKFALSLYFGTSNPGSTYGAAGSIILIMLWVSYSGLILLFGAEFTHVYANQHKEKQRPVS
jgi:membrane protein